MKNLKIILYVLAVIACSVCNANPQDDFFIAIRNDNVGEVKALLQQGIDPNARDAKGQPGLTIAMREQSLKAAQVLLAQPQIDVNALNQAAESPLMIAALKGGKASAELLLAHGAAVNRPGWSPLHYAATGPNPQIVELLLEHGAAVDAPSPNGTTPLMMAAQYGSEDSVRLLLKHGADWKQRNERGLDAADFARLAGRDSLAEQLQKLKR